MKRNKTLKSLVGLALSASILASTTALAQVVSVSSIVEHPALDSIRDGVKQALADAGYTEDKGLKWQFQTAQGNTAIASQIARKFVGDKSDVIVAISTPSAQAVVAATKSIPVLYSGVTDPVAAQLVPSWEPSKTNVSGVSDMLVLEKQLDLIKKVAPDAKTVGMVYNPGEANSVVVVERLRELLSANDMNLVEATAARTVDVGAAARSLVGKADVFYTNTDNNVVSAFEALVKVGNDSKIPIIASDTDSVGRGAIAALGVNYYDLGVQTGKMVVRVLKGEKPGDIASETSDQLELFVNPSAAAKQGVTLDEAFIQSATKIIE
ncbi:ABC transporter substrate-binding protein [Paenalcaligenes hominis]|uniref:ABC transporter substrate-binding protein n=1 Tax=Paenalcaligenes hominis TaxID=643674 RepID=UPI00352411AF